MLEKIHFLALKLDYLENIANKVEIEIDTVKIKQIIDSLKRSYEDIEDNQFQQQREMIEEELHHFVNTIVAYKKGRFALYDELNEQIYHKILANDERHIKHLFEIAYSIYEEGANVNRWNREYETLLHAAIKMGNHPIINCLLKNNADPNFGIRKPLITAIKLKDEKLVRLLIKYGAEVNINARSTTRKAEPLREAVKSGSLKIVQLLLENKARIKIDPHHVIRGPADRCSSPITDALKWGHLDIATYLLNTTQSKKLFPLHYFLAIKNAPLSMLSCFIEDELRSPKEPFTRKVQTWIGKKHYQYSAEALLDKLLLSSSDPKQRLLVLKELISALLSVNFLSTTTTQDIDHYKKLPEEQKEGPKADIVKQLKACINNASLNQGLIIAGFCFLSTMINKYKYKDDVFYPGMQLINMTLKYLKPFVKHNRELPTQENIRSWIELQNINTTLTVTKAPAKNPAIHRFSTMVGSSVFSKNAFILINGGKPKEAASWYSEIITTIMQVLGDLNLLKPEWNIEKAIQLLNETASMDSNPIADKLAYGFDLDFPEHYISSILFKEAEHWVYIVQCRSFLQPENQDKGSVRFIIPLEHFANVHQLLENRTRFVEMAIEEEDVTQAIYIQLLTHFMAIEKITGLQGFYSKGKGQKPYKIDSCFTSNMKLYLPVILELAIKPETSFVQWQGFHEKLIDLIKIEINQKDIALDEKEGTIDKELSPQDLAYKLITLLLRWREINRFHPESETELAGYEATLKHVLKHTKTRTGLYGNFFQPVSKEEVNDSIDSGQLKHPSF